MNDSLTIGRSIFFVVSSPIYGKQSSELFCVVLRSLVRDGVRIKVARETVDDCTGSYLQSSSPPLTGLYSPFYIQTDFSPPPQLLVLEACPPFKYSTETETIHYSRKYKFPLIS